MDATGLLPDLISQDPYVAQGIIEQQMLEAGDGARGIVYGEGPDMGHVFNVYNNNGQVLFIDSSSSGRFFDGLQNIRFGITGFGN